MESPQYLTDKVEYYGNLVSPALTTTFADLDFNTKLFTAAILAGITSHVGYFIRGEHHRSTVQIVKAYIALEIVIAGLFIRQNGSDLKTGVIQAGIVTVAYLLGLFGAIGVYRGFFHPLRGFSGPFFARFSNLYHSSLLGNSDNYRVIDNLHKEHGPIVRTGECYPVRSWLGLTD